MTLMLQDTKILRLKLVGLPGVTPNGCLSTLSTYITLFGVIFLSTFVLMFLSFQHIFGVIFCYQVYFLCALTIYSIVIFPFEFVAVLNDMRGDNQLDRYPGQNSPLFFIHMFFNLMFMNSAVWVTIICDFVPFAFEISLMSSFNSLKLVTLYKVQFETFSLSSMRLSERLTTFLATKCF